MSDNGASMMTKIKTKSMPFKAARDPFSEYTFQAQELQKQSRMVILFFFCCYTLSLSHAFYRSIIANMCVCISKTASSHFTADERIMMKENKYKRARMGEHVMNI